MSTDNTKCLQMLQFHIDLGTLEHNFNTKDVLEFIGAQVQLARNWKVKWYHYELMKCAFYCFIKAKGNQLNMMNYATTVRGIEYMKEFLRIKGYTEDYSFEYFWMLDIYKSFNAMFFKQQNAPEIRGLYVKLYKTMRKLFVDGILPKKAIIKSMRRLMEETRVDETLKDERDKGLEISKSLLRALVY